MRLAHDRWDFILPTKRGLATPRRELLPDTRVVVVNGAVSWTKSNRANIWATDMVVSIVASFPPHLEVWGPLESGPAFREKGIPFTPMPENAVVGPGGVPRPADAFFRALGLAIDHCGARRIRIHGARDWSRADVRWKRWALANMARLAAGLGVEIERPR